MINLHLYLNVSTMIKRTLVFVYFTLICVGLSPAETGINWPVQITDEQGEIVIYQPQVEKFTQNVLECRSAVMVTTKEFPEGVFGAIWYKYTIDTDKDARMVYFRSMDVLAAKFPSLDSTVIEVLTNFLEKRVEENSFEISLDRLIASIDLPDESLQQIENLNNAPPEIIYSQKPAVLIMVDGNPIYEKLESTSYQQVINTPYFMVSDGDKKKHYIKGGDYWFVSVDNLKAWKPLENPPKDLVKLADDLLDKEEGEAREDDSIMVRPELYVRTKPAELLQSDGEPQFAPLKGTHLLYMSNTDDDIIMDIAKQEYYVLISGRWYKALSLVENKWEFVDPDKIPADFSLIAENSEMAEVRSSIPGTIEAKEAVLENQIPQTAVIDRSDATLEIAYDGDPKFEAIKDTKMQYAVNTDKSVLKIEGSYYCCDNAVWFESKSANGPWVVSTKVPDQVQDIPADNPNYNIKYVYIYNSTPEVVYIGYTPGYTHSYVYHGSVYYGTGYYYHPWYGRYYYPRPVTYGYRVHYNPYSGWGFSFGYAYGSPYAWMSFSMHHHRNYWGPHGYRHGYHRGYNRGYYNGYRHGQASGNRPGNKPDNKPGNRPGSKPSNTRPTPEQRPASNNIYSDRKNGVKETGNVKYNPKNGDRVSQLPQDKAARPSTQPADRKNNVYTDKAGNVYRKEGNDWQKRDNGNWQSAPSKNDRSAKPQTRPSQPAQQPQTRPQTRPQQPAQQPQTRPSSPNTMNRDFDSRNRGNQRSQNYNQNRQNYQYQQPNRSGGGTRQGSGQSRSGGTRRR